MQATYKKAGIDMQIQFESQPSVFSTYNKGPQNFAEYFPPGSVSRSVSRNLWIGQY